MQDNFCQDEGRLGVDPAVDVQALVLDGSLNDEVFYLAEDVAVNFVNFEILDGVFGLFLPELLVFQQFISDDEALVISLLYGLLDLLIVGLDGKPH